MSIEALSAVLSFNVSDATRKLVLIGLANHAHKDGTAAYAGVKLLADYANCAPRTVQRHVATLLDMGFLREGDQSVVNSDIEPRYRPIVYEVALTTSVAQKWMAGRAPGRRDASAVHGSVGGAVSARNRRGDNLAPLAGGTGRDDQDAARPRGDRLSPLDAPLRGDKSGVTGVTDPAFRGDTHVTQTVLEPTAEPNPKTYVAADASTDVEEQADPPLTAAQPSTPRAPAGTARGSRLPDGFEVTPRMRAWAAEKAPLVDLDYETGQFTGYWRTVSGGKGVKLDWPLVWMTWMTRTQKRAAGRSNGSGRYSPGNRHVVGDAAMHDERRRHFA